jgi:hypothetical protein
MAIVIELSDSFSQPLDRHFHHQALRRCCYEAADPKAKADRLILYEERGKMSADNPPKPEPWKGTISQLAEKLAESVESWSDYDKAIFRASLTGKLGPTTEKVQ